MNSVRDRIQRCKFFLTCGWRAWNGNGGWEIGKSPYFIHIGSNDVGYNNSQGNNGCVAVCTLEGSTSRGAFTHMQNLFEKLSGTTNKSEMIINLIIEPANKPSLIFENPKR